MVVDSTPLISIEIQSDKLFLISSWIIREINLSEGTLDLYVKGNLSSFPLQNPSFSKRVFASLGLYSGHKS